ncbi:MAG: hypothetical protein ACREA9_25260 [Pyrinomonadaceae bacterium]
MAETEVESILREIRERVLFQQRPGKGLSATGSVLSNEGNGEQITQQGEHETRAAENLSLINSYLTTTARAWNRLPPLASNRGGLIARVELWLKRQLKRTTHWYTWEQVNFNNAVHHALRDLLPVLSAHEHELRAQLAQAEARRAELRSELETRIAELANELRERDERLQDEQRVCYKQLGLETSEAAVLEDRARRKTEALLEDIQRRIAELEKGKK